MNCPWIDQYENDQISEKTFRQHAKKCVTCQKYLTENEKLMKLALSLKQEIHAPSLWNRIEKALEKEDKKIVKRIEKPFWVRAYPVLKFAAVLALFLSAGLFFWNQLGHSQKNILAESALKRVEKQEAAYIRAIEELENKSESKMEAMDLELAFLYRDRLETIDAQIDRCREALETNPGNAHIRRYMLAALQEKKETLKEILSSST